MKEAYWKTTEGISDTPWLGKPLKFRQLRKNISVDCIIVGGGISGLTTAYLLSEKGKKVAVVEDGFLGSGETGRTTAHISWVFDTGFPELLRIHGKEKAKLATQSHKQAINIIEKIIKKENIDCDFERLSGFLFGSHADLKNELKALHTLNLHEVKFVNSPVKKIKIKCLLFPEQAQFHVIKYLNSLAKAINKNKGQIFTETHAQEIGADSITTDKGFRINAKYIIITTNAPVNKNNLYMKQAPYRTYVIASLIPKGSFPKILLWDTEEPYHYVRAQRYNDSHDLLIVGGEDHRTGQKNDGKKRFLVLERWARRHFPKMGGIEFRWSGQVLESFDGLSFIGKSPGAGKENIYIASGDCGSGMTHGTIAGKLISDLILGNKNPWQEIYNPARKSVFLTKKFMEETGKTFEQYFKWLEIEHVYPRLKKNEGMIVQAGLKKVAAYKDKRGKVHLHSAVCPHMGCIVQWNDAEKSFDCPCHGSRFSAGGNVVNGPANKNLSEWKEKEKRR